MNKNVEFSYFYWIIKKSLLGIILAVSDLKEQVQISVNFLNGLL